MAANSIGRERKDYTGSKSTLCSGCGHDSITNNIISALYQSSADPYKLAKISGIGCSSKTPTYFSDKSAGFNSLHGRMAPLATGVKLANHELEIVGISGDGDTASIGLGGFCHLLRRNLPMTYVVENNGVYGLTKGQFSATADEGSRRKTGQTNTFASIDLCALAIEMGCGFVARSFSGDSKQLVPLLRAAMEFEGTAFIDIISPCVTFANHLGSTKSYDAVKERKIQLQQLGFINPADEIEADYKEGDVHIVTLHDGSKLALKKLGDHEHDVTNKMSAMTVLQEARQNDQFATGLFYFDESSPDLMKTHNLVKAPLASLGAKDLSLSQDQLDKVLEGFG